jgi:hypothetical protein
VVEKVKLGSRLDAAISTGEWGSKLVLEGFIDEHAELAQLIPHLEYPLEIDLFGVERINSIGVRSWINFISEVSSCGAVRLLRCPPVLVHQFSLVTSTLGSAVVRSVLVPYSCKACGAVEHQDVVLDESFDPRRPNALAPERRCGRCAGLARFDDEVDFYFMFLSARNV